METARIVDLAGFLIWGVLGTAAFLVFLKAATGRINLRGLLQSKDGSGISAARVQLLLLTLISAFGYLGTVAHAVAEAKASGTLENLRALHALPEVPSEILAALGGSSGFYLGAKGLITGGWLARLRGN